MITDEWFNEMLEKYAVPAKATVIMSMETARRIDNALWISKHRRSEIKKQKKETISQIRKGRGLGYAGRTSRFQR